MPKHKPNPTHGPETIPFLWADVRSLLNSHALRPCEGRSGKEQVVDVDIQRVRDAVDALILRQRLRPGPLYAVSLRDVCDELQRDLRRLDWDAVQICLVNALNDENSGLELVRCRRLAMAS